MPVLTDQLLENPGESENLTKQAGKIPKNALIKKIVRNTLAYFTLGERFTLSPSSLFTPSQVSWSLRFFCFYSQKLISFFKILRQSDISSKKVSQILSKSRGNNCHLLILWRKQKKNASPAIYKNGSYHPHSSFGLCKFLSDLSFSGDSLGKPCTVADVLDLCLLCIYHLLSLFQNLDSISSLLI